MALNEGLCPVNHNNIIQGKILFWFQILNEQCKICISFAVKYVNMTVQGSNLRQIESDKFS